MTGNEYIINACKELVKLEYARSLSAIARKCGRTTQYFTDLKNGKATYSREFLEILVEKYPVNRDYVLTGKGEMLKSEKGNIEPNHEPLNDEKAMTLGMIDRLTRMLEKSQQETEMLKQENERLKQEISALENGIDKKESRTA